MGRGEDGKKAERLGRVADMEGFDGGEEGRGGTRQTGRRGVRKRCASETRERI